MDRLVFKPGDVRGGGNIISPAKTVNDFQRFNSKLISSSTVIDNMAVNVFKETYLSGSFFTVTYSKLLPLDTESFNLTVVLKRFSNNAVISNAAVQCIVNNGTVLTGTTNSSGQVVFTVDCNEFYVYTCQLIYEGTSSVAGAVSTVVVRLGEVSNIELISEKTRIVLNETGWLISKVTGLDGDGNSVPVPYTEVSFYELYTLGVLLSKPSDVLKGGTVPLSARLIDSEDYSRLFFEDEEIGFYERFIRDKVYLTGSNQFIKANEESVLSAKVLDTDGSYISDVPVYFEEDITGKFAFGGLTGNHVLIGETTGLSVPLYSDVLLESATVSCDTDGTNYCYSVGFDELGLDLSSADFTLEFDYRNTVNGGRLCLGDASSWSTGRGAGDNYIYIGTSTAGNGGYGTKTSGATDNTSTGAVSVDTVLHWKIVRSGNTLRYYLDGTLKGTKSVPDWVADCHSWSLYFQCWNTGDFTVRNVSLDMGSDNDLSGFFVRFYVDEPEGVDDEVIIPVAEEPEPVVSSVGLVGSKSVLSAYDRDTCILTATVLDEEDNPMEGESVVFKQGSTTLATKQTNSSGVASYTYSAAGSGDVSFTASVGSIVSGTYSVSDVYFHRDTEYSLTKSSGSVLNQAIANDISLTLPSNFELTFDIQSTGGTSSNEHRFFIQPKSLYVSATQPRYGLFVDNRGSSTGGFGHRNNGTTTSIGSTFSTYTTNEYHTVKIEREGNSLLFYFEDSLIATQTINYLDNYTDWNFYYHLWNNGTMKIRNITLK